jgi:hypothetical protein
VQNKLLRWPYDVDPFGEASHEFSLLVLSLVRVATATAEKVEAAPTTTGYSQSKHLHFWVASSSGISYVVIFMVRYIEPFEDPIDIFGSGAGIYDWPFLSSSPNSIY